MRPAHRQQGVGLIEVLVALIVVSFGVLGMAGLQLTGMKHSTNGFNRSKALILTENMATRMRTNTTGVSNGSYAGFDSSAAANADLCENKPIPYCQAYKDVDAQSCSVDELAEFDKFSVTCGDWGPDGATAGVQGLLPAGAKLEVICDETPCAATSTYTLSVSWPENPTASSEETVSKRVQMRLRP